MNSNVYSDIFSTVNRLFKSKALLRTNIPETIINWMSTLYSTIPEGRVLQYEDAYIILLTNLDNRFMIESIMINDNICKLVIISDNVINFDNIEDLFNCIVKIYKVLLSKYKEVDKSENYYNILVYAPYILAARTFISFNYEYDYKWEIFKEDNIIPEVVLESFDYEIDQLFINGELVKIISNNTAN